MPRMKHKAEEIVSKLRQVDVLVAQGNKVADAVRSISVSQLTYLRDIGAGQGRVAAVGGGGRHGRSDRHRCPLWD